MPPTDLALLFDLGGVLVDVDLERAKGNLAHLLGTSPAAVDAGVFASGLKDGFDRGVLDADAFLATLLERFPSPDPPSAGRLAVAWCDLFQERPEATRLLPELAQRHALYVCSNTDPLHAGYILDSYPWSRHFQDAWLSFEAGVAKPDPAYFEGALAAFGLTPAGAVLLDDRAENIAAAAALGLHTIHVTSRDAVAEGLRGLGAASP